MQFHTSSFKEPIKKIAEARAYLNFLAFGTEEVHGANHQIIKAVAEAVKDLPDWYFFHDYLEEENNPIYFSAFASKLSKHKLKHISDADISLFVPQEFSSEVQISLRTFSKTTTYMEQTMDFLRGQSFRRAIICHKDQQLSGHPQIQPIKNFYLSAPLQFESKNTGVATFIDPFRGHSLQTKDPLFAESLKYLGNIWPASVSFADLAKHLDASESESEALLTLFLRAFISGSVSFDSLPSVMSDSADGNPRPFAVARALEKRGASVINFKHENILLNEQCRKVLRFADGTRSAEMIATETGLDIELMLKLLKQFSLI
jgi:methyltransferase-like protein